MDAQLGFNDFFYKVPDGLTLHARIYGENNNGALPVVCLPGLTRNARDFHQLAYFLANVSHPKRRVICFDYRGRGLSDHDPDWKKYDVGVEAGDILAGLAELGISKAIFIGTSRGGLILHVLAAVRPDLLAAVILNDIGPVLEPAGLALIKSYLSTPSLNPATYQAAASVQKTVHGTAFTALDESDWLDMAHAIYREIGGKLRPDFDPALLNGLAALDLSKPLPTLWPQFDAMVEIPVMVIRGANSLLLSAETVMEMQRRHPTLQAVTVDGQGHAPFLHTSGLAKRIVEFIKDM
ncbi:MULTISPECIES: alpha/beta fold hydrolase [Mesorhizobium]|uniref:Alpha/beta hydrolase n=1 Tax=Mesorhizobium denitrificans TaxID=2294114 RepID=A0A371XIY6_9HYPH|nr:MULTISPECIES: alpha/beta hydrolase [Mesorhizobium]RFC69185.1 alpha/beta hydrolase [Mesorhizobium denitrificans]